MRTRLVQNRLVPWGLFLVLAGAMAASPCRADRPNLVWIVVDDMSPHFGCYGERLISTPRIDALAAGGIRFENCFTTAPVCSPCRSALITGCYQTTIGAHHHRSGRGERKITLPNGVEPLPAILKRAGYYTCLGGPSVTGTHRLGKSDYNFEWDPAIYDSNDWGGRQPGQPFFMQVQLHGGKLREGAGWKERAQARLGELVDPRAVTLPPCYPNDSILAEDWARYLDACRWTDAEVGEVVDRLQREGLRESTVVIVTTDHGISHARGKQSLYDQGLRVPLILNGPGIAKGLLRSDLAQLIDLAPTTLALAGLPIPPRMQGMNLLAEDRPERSMIFAARDRCDETVDQIRCIRTHRWKYIRNGFPGRPLLQPNAYKDAKPIVQRLRELQTAGTLTAEHEQLLFAPTRPREELYDLQHDPDELRNLAGDARSAAELARFRELLTAWQTESNDLGATDEPRDMYESDMQVYLQELPPERRSIVERNIGQMQAWARDGQ
ncbi:MAG: sulfatase [Planctomycetaceae bacterium]